MDLTQYSTSKADTGAQMQVYDIHGQKAEGVFITLLGQDSKVFRAIERRKQQDMINRMSQRKGKRGIDLDPDQIVEDSLQELTDLTVDMGKLTFGKDKIGSDKELIKRAYREYPWLADQAREFIADRANFI